MNKRKKSMARLAVSLACDDYTCSVFDLDKRVKKMNDKERARKKKNMPLIDEVVDRFWDLFFPKRPELFQFSVAQSEYFPKE